MSEKGSERKENECIQEKMRTREHEREREHMWASDRKRKQVSEKASVEERASKALRARAREHMKETEGESQLACTCESATLHATGLTGIMQRNMWKKARLRARRSAIKTKENKKGETKHVNSLPEKKDAETSLYGLLLWTILFRQKKKKAF